MQDEASQSGRIGRFNRRFEGIGGAGEQVEWMDGVTAEQSQGELVDPGLYTKKKPKKK